MPPTKTENDFSYNAGVGLRFDVNRQFSLQGSYNKTWIDISKASGHPRFRHLAAGFHLPDVIARM